MTTPASRSVKGMDPKAREIAGDPARRSGARSGGWLGRLFAGGRTRTIGPAVEAEPMLAALRALTERFEASERDQAERAARFEAAVARLQADQAEALRRLEAAERGGGRGEALRALEAALERLVALWGQAEGRSGPEVEALREEMRAELQRAADETDGKLQALERKNAEAVAEVGFEMTRAAEAVEQRLRRSDLARAEAWSRLGAEIARLGEKLHAPSMAPRPVASELTDRIRQSEGRMAQLLAEARAAAAARTAAAKAESAAAFEPIVVTPLPRPKPAKVPRRRLALTIGVAAVCVGLGLALYAVWSAQTAPPPPPAPAPVKPVAAPPAAARKAAPADPAILFREAAKRLDAGDASGAALLMMAADLGYPPAQGRLGKLYAIGGAGLVKDPVQSQQWSRKAAEGGDAQAMYDLAQDLAHGAGVPKDSAESVLWLQRAALRGLREGQRSLGRDYETGSGLPQDPAAAYEWYLVAAQAGDPEAATRADALKGRLAAGERSRAEATAAVFRPIPPAWPLVATPGAKPADRPLDTGQAPTTR